MPTLSGKAGKAGKSGKAEKAKGPAKKGKVSKASKQVPTKKRAPAQPTIVDDDDFIEESAGAKGNVGSPGEIQLAQPMQGDVVSPTLASVLIVPRIAGEELATLKGFLRYYTLTGIYVGSIVSKTSFMRKKGGVLL